MIRAFELPRGFFIEEGTGGKNRLIQEKGVFIPYPYATDIPFMAALRDFLTKWCYEADKGEDYPTYPASALLLAAFDKRNLPHNQLRKELSRLQIELSTRSESEKREALLKGEESLDLSEQAFLDTLCRFASNPSFGSLLTTESKQNTSEQVNTCPSSTSKSDEE